MLLKLSETGGGLERPAAAEEDRPLLTRELKALLKLLAKKGILTPKEYFDLFKETK